MKTRILAIAPYEGLRELLLNKAAAFSDEVDIVVHVGDLADGLSIAKSLDEGKFDVILSRGGTAELLKAHMRQPVVDIMPSVLDILRFVGIARNTACPYALVAFPAITEMAHKVFDLLGQDEKIVTLHEAGEAELAILKLKSEGYTVIVGDAIACATAQRMNMNAILIASGTESIQQAYKDAIQLASAIQNSENRNLSFRAILEESPLSVLAFDANQNMIYSNLSDDHIDYPRVFRTIKSLVPATLAQGELRLCRRSKEFAWDIIGRNMTHPLGQCAVFYVEKKLLLSSSKSNVMEYYHMLSDNEPADEPPIDTLGQMQEVLQNAEKLGRTLLPVLVSGEKGTPVTGVVHMIYTASPWHMHTLVTVDCALMDDSALQWLLKSEDSVFCSNKLNIFMKNIESLPEAFCRHYIDFAKTTALHKRNRVIYASSAPIPDCLSAFFSECSCLTLALPPLRHRREDLPGLANLYLGSLNSEAGHQFIGFTQSAIALIQEYDWPGNQDQLRSVIRQAGIISDSDFVTHETLQTILQTALPSPAHSGDRESVSLNGTLDEITSRIVKIILAQEGDNRSRTVERLGISRSTLWRMLK